MWETGTTLLAQLSNIEHAEKGLATPASFLHDNYNSTVKIKK